MSAPGQVFVRHEDGDSTFEIYVQWIARHHCFVLHADCEGLAVRVPRRVLAELRDKLALLLDQIPEKPVPDAP